MYNICQRCSVVRLLSVSRSSACWLKDKLVLVVRHQFARHMIWLYVVTFLFVLPLLCHDVRFSLYYFDRRNITERQEVARHLNTRRLAEATSFFELARSNSLKAMLGQLEMGSSSRELDVAITVITVSRNRNKFDSYTPRYLTQVSYQLLNILLHHQRQSYMTYSYTVSLCNVDSHPESYHEAANLSQWFRTFKRPEPLSDHWNIFEREKQDYAFCLNASLGLGSRYVLLMEDDALPHPDLVPVMERLIGGWVGQGTAYVKMYHPERVLGFINLEWERLPELVSVGLVLGTMLSRLYILLQPTCRSYSYRMWAVCVLYWVLVALAVGRPAILELRRYFAPHLYSIVPTPTCCTPAILYPQDVARDLVNYFSNVICDATFAKDMALSTFTHGRGKKGYLVSPNLFQHIGMYSSLRSEVLDPHII